MSKDKVPAKQDTLTALMVANVLIGLLLILFAIGFVYVQSAGDVTADSQMAAKYAGVARDRLAEHAELLEKEAMALASETVPPITDAVYQQARRDFPKYVNVVEREGEVLLSNVEQTFIRQVKDQYRDYLKLHRQVLQQEFPKYTSEENVDRVMKEFEETFSRLVERYYLAEFRREAKQTQELWVAIEPLPQPGPGEPSLQEQLADYTSDWTMLALNDPGNAERDNATRDNAEHHKAERNNASSGNADGVDGKAIQ